MKKLINRKTYNTETAEQVNQRAFGNFGDTDGYEEILYKTHKGDFFIYGVGGPDSKYPEPNIVAVTKEEAEQF